MFSLPLYTFLFLYFIFLTVFIAFSAVNFYHIVATASFTFVSFLASFFVFAMTILTLYLTWQLLQNVAWQTPVVLFDGNWLSGIFGEQSGEGF